MTRFLAIVLMTAGAALAQQEVDLPVTRAVLFSSGVGYFEHAGEVTGDARLSLRFKTDQINDVLKSMVFEDAGGGTVSTITYASNDPVERALKSFGIDLSNNPTLPDLLGQLRGAVVTVKAPGEVRGSILNVEEKQSVAGDDDDVVTTEHFLVLVTEQGIRTLPMKTIESLELADPKLRDELNKALALLVSARDTERKQVDIDFRGQGKRSVRVGYLVETPVWKTSYRLDLSPLAKKEKPLLQGWAIVENTSDSDWNRVGLSLVSGRPISFVMDLYTPLYLQRPEVRPQLMASLTPRTYAEGIEPEEQKATLRGQMRAEKMMARREAAAAPAPAAAMESDGFKASFYSSSGGIAMGESIRAAASAGSVGELFQYTLREAVDMPRRRSAMIPIINQGVDAEKVSIYNQSVHATHPLNGVWLSNSTDLKMLAGPVTVFDGSSYAGDAQIDHLAPGDKRLLSYAVDLAMVVDPSIRSSSRLTAGKIVRGVLEISNIHTWEQTYKLKNKAEQDRVVIVEHPFVTGRKLLSPEKYEEKTAELYRFRIPVEQGKIVDFIVKEEQVVSQGFGLVNLDLNTLLVYQRDGAIPDKVRQSLSQVAAERQELAALEAKHQQETNELSQIKSGQERLRENIKTVGSDSQLGKRYLGKLAAEEDRIEELEKSIDTLLQQVEGKRNELTEFLKNLNVQ